jgi:hypothetical protein
MVTVHPPLGLLLLVSPIIPLPLPPSLRHPLELTGFFWGTHSDHVSIGENFIRIAFCKDLELRAPIFACPYNSTYLFSSRCC